MEVILLIACVTVAWALSTTLDHLPALGQLLVPSHWVLAGVVLVVATWLLHD